MTRRVVILSAGMGAGHDGVAVELAGRLAARGAEVEVIDVLQVLPFRLGPLLRGWYQWAIRRAPWLYEVIYQVFFTGKRGPSSSPLAALGAARLVRLPGPRGCDEVVSTFHLAAQMAGLLRERGLLRARSTVLVTDFAVHRMWLHPGNDRYLCPDPAAAGPITAATGRPASPCAPVVRPEFRPAATRAEGAGALSGTRRNGPAGVRRRIGAREGDRLVLISSGSWGVGRVERTARLLARSGRYTPVVLCAGNDALRRRLAVRGAGIALGWRDDLPELMAAAYALVDNAAGLTCEEAFAAGLPVVSYLPIAGHGRDGALAMARAGVSAHARRGADLLRALDDLGDRRERALALFGSPPADSLIMPLPAPALSPPAPAPGWGATGTEGSSRR
ncbi:hypothetical protein Ssi03_59090 [Sphaerisporangium siamense]|uniref:Diacylglycerol glucosyltransferase N-terminal domain-containing protein n=1 Tax=Sphaerisporangium siamense TaxID=795645 RepID=A0A7W7D6C6_9ACTN|nr:hypothetical protein [Sphaerisporangium siamense]MBB4699738.1 hypothetical protein [Sphaerisporangium siamense]GII87919.1 hypothetical protein Ssi03_59090 [Sphaerisporangium siamense]